MYFCERKHNQSAMASGGCYASPLYSYFRCIFMPQLAAVIIAFNEAHNIRRCLASLQEVADEVWVIDGFSTDDTVAICKEMRAIVVQREWQGYALTKNFAHTLPNCEFLLSIDADEALSPALKQEILSIKPNLQGAYSFPRLNFFCGKPIYHGGWYPDRKIRIFPRTAYWEGEVHEQLITHCAETRLKADLWHYSYQSVAELAVKGEKYATLGAQTLINKKKKVGFLKLWFSPIIRFIRMYFLQAGFLDGYFGWIIAKETAKSVWLKYYKARSIRPS